MDNKLFSPLLSSANTIAGNKRTLTKKATDYQSFINFLDASNKDLKKIKLPSKRKIKNLANDIELRLESGGGGGGFNPVKMLTDALIGGAEGLAGGLGLRALVKGVRGGKNAAKAAEEGENIFTKVNKAAQTAEKTEVGVKAANKIVGFDRKALGKGAEELTEKEGGKVATQAAEKGALKVGGGVVKRALPLVGAFFSIASAIDDAKKGNFAGAGLNAVSAVADLFGQSEISLATAAGAIGTELTYKGSSKDKLGEKLKKQEKKQREAASKKLTLADVVNKFDKVVSKFEKISFGISGGSTAEKKEDYEPSNQPLAPNDPTEPPPPPLPPGTNSKAPDEVLTDASAFRQAFPLAKGAPKLSNEPYELQMRENTSLGELGNDPTVDAVHAKGSAHYENRAIDIPINNMELGDKVADWWRGKGYKVLWKVEGHFNHVHVQWSKGQKKDKEPKAAGAKDEGGLNTLQKQQSIEDFAKGTKEGDRILKDPNLKAQLTGKKYQYKGSMVTTPVTDPGVKQMMQNYNAYVRNIKQVRADQAKVRGQARPELPTEITTPPPTETAPGSSVLVVNNQPQTQQAAPQVVPIPIPTGGGGGGSSAMGGNSLVGEVVNSFAKLILLTNLSGS